MFYEICGTVPSVLDDCDLGKSRIQDCDDWIPIEALYFLFSAILVGIQNQIHESPTVFSNDFEDLKSRFFSHGQAAQPAEMFFGCKFCGGDFGNLQVGRALWIGFPTRSTTGLS